MKIGYRFGLVALLMVVALLLVACGKPVIQSDLYHRNFVLTEINGKPFEGERIPNLEFNEDFRVSGAICNSYMGQGELVGDLFYVRSMASTKMLCPERELSELEFSFANMLMKGAKLSYEGNFLILEGDGNSLKFTLRDYVN